MPQRRQTKPASLVSSYSLIHCNRCCISLFIDTNYIEMMSMNHTRKIIGLFALGTSYQDIRAHIEELYGINVSNCTLNAVTDKLLPELQAWRERELDAIYPIVWFDAIHYKIKENSRYLTKAMYTILGVTVEGKKELLGLYLSEHEGAHHWLTVLTDLHNRGVKDILLACVDGLKGSPEAIESIYRKRNTNPTYPS